MLEVLIKNLQLHPHQRMMFQRLIQTLGMLTGVTLMTLMTQFNRY
ncbi:hypothetical protein MtrunA17_Chr3g0121511 [Medicago truncatula]|uniref:Transmembrane protein n=1 Tax=Medicago truncatula TaxID=3880 RepID=A0A396IWU9_MEDTR|nr:hypothetical protein MtrunA17_Chr3g0121511 [Medicago truncatula]